MVKIKSKKNVTQDPVAEIKKEMEEMRKRMQEEIDALKAVTEGKAVPKSEKAKELEELLEAQAQSEKELREDMERRMANLSKTDEERAADRDEARDQIDSQWQDALGGAVLQKPEDVKEPHLRNLNEDPRLAETLVYALKAGENKVGRSNKDDPPNIEFNGLGIIRGHCIMTWDEEGGTVHISPSVGASVMVNGKRVSEKTELRHNSRLWLGNNYAFRFVFPGKEADGEKIEGTPDYLLAAGEVAENNNTDIGGSLDGVSAEVQHQLTEAVKKVQQANIIAQDLHKEIIFTPGIVKHRETQQHSVVVNVKMPQGKLLWAWGNFNSKLADMVKIWQMWQHAQDNELPFEEPTGADSPFIDQDDQLIGEASVWLKSLGNMIDFSADPTIFSLKGSPEGKLHCEINPLDEKGGEGPWEGDREELDPFVEDISEMKGKEMGFVVKIQKIVFDVDITEAGAGANFEQVFVRYKFDMNDEEEEWHKTELDQKCSLTPQFNFSKKHTKTVDANLIHHVTKKSMVFQVWGKLSDSVRPTAAAGGAGGRQKLHEERQGVLRGLSNAIAVAKQGPPKLPPGWEPVAAFRAPDGSLHAAPPGAASVTAQADDDEIAS